MTETASLEERERAKRASIAMSKVSNRAGIAKLLIIVCSIGLAMAFARIGLLGGWFALLWIPNVLASVWAQHAIAEEIHDGVHVRIFSSPSANDTMSGIYAALIGISFEGFRREHMLHHRHFGAPGDPDYIKYATKPIGARAWTVYFLANFSGYSAIKRLVLSAGERQGKRSLLPQHPLGTAAAQVLLLVLGAVLVHPLWYFLGWALPLVTITYGITQFRTMLEHWSEAGWTDPKTGEPRVGALFNLTGPLQRNLFGAQFGYNFHGSHHRHASVPNYRLEAISEIDADYIDGAPMQTVSFLKRAKQVIR